MGCQGTGNQTQSGHCVKNTIQLIINAQRKAVEKETVTCLTSCERSIDDLLSPDRDRRRPRHTTIPFMLICKNSCKQFIGSGVVKRYGSNGRYFECLESPVFKARGFVRGSNNCVKLELLLPITSCGNSTGGTGDTCTPGNFFPTGSESHINGFKETGVCITVDLNGFIGITCLDPITPQKA